MRSPAPLKPRSVTRRPGAGVLEVTSGYVALEHGDRESIIPAGLVCLTDPGLGPGTPFSTTATVELRAALARLASPPEGPQTG